MPRKIIDHNLGPVDLGVVKTVAVYNPGGFPFDANAGILGIRIDEDGDQVYRTEWPVSPDPLLMYNCDYVWSEMVDDIIPDEPPTSVPGYQFGGWHESPSGRVIFWYEPGHE